MRVAIVLVISLLHGVAFAQANYSKAAEVPPLRTSFADLQTVLDKAATLVTSANVGAQVRREEVVMKAGAISVTLPGHDLTPKSARIPEKIEALTYTYTALEPAKVSRVSIDLADYRRIVTVEGPSPEQVDAVFAVIREELLSLSTPVGGSVIKSMLGFPSILFLMWVLGWSAAGWYARRTPLRLAIVLSTLALLGLLAALPLDELLAGFWAVRGEPSFLIRYGPHMSFIGFLIAVVGVPLTVLQLLPRPTSAKTSGDRSKEG